MKESSKAPSHANKLRKSVRYYLRRSNSGFVQHFMVAALARKSYGGLFSYALDR
jgi:hypothetical protein